MRIRPCTVVFAAAVALAMPGQRPLLAQSLDAPTPLEEVDPPSPDREEALAAEPAKVKPAPARVGPEPRPAKSKEAAAAALPAGAPGTDTSAARAIKPLLVSPAKGEELEAVYERWRKATLSLDRSGAAQAKKTLLELREEVGAMDLEGFSMGFARASLGRQQANDPAGAVELAVTAVELAPNLPFAHWALARAYWGADKANVGRALAALGSGLSALVSHPRYARVVLADVLAAALLALLATAVAVALVLFGRRARYAFHDFRHLLPRGAAAWQAGALLGVVVALPVVFRLGLFAILLGVLGSVAFYLTLRERLVAAALVASLAVLPYLAGWAVERTSFAGTLAEEIDTVEQGGPRAAAAAERLRSRLGGGRTQFAVSYALGRLALRRGDSDNALRHFKDAAALRNAHAGVLTNLGNAMFMRGDVDGAAEMYGAAMQADPSLVAPAYNATKLYARRAAAALSREGTAAELDRAQAAAAVVTRLSPQLLARPEPPEDKAFTNRVLVSPPLPKGELSPLALGSERAAKVKAQLSRQLAGDARPLFALLAPLLGGAFFVLLGAGRRRLGAALPCDKCGRPVCRRCDPELPVVSKLCNQCMHAFAKRGAVAPAMKVRKQVEVARYRDRMDRASYILSAICSGAGHLFAGLPVRGALYVFLFLFVFFQLLFRDGVVRAPYGGLPALLKLAPFGLLFVAVYLLTLRGLIKRQS